MSATWPASANVVVDASVTVWTVLPVLAGIDPLSHFVAWRQQGQEIIAPAHWAAEATSAIRRSVYLKVISPEEGLQAITDLYALDVELIVPDAQLCHSALNWAGRLGQSKAYDGFYVALSEQLVAEFWTADKRLANGAHQIGATWVHWLGEN
jgi:predicted nucleic acid-binding protein